MKPKDDWWKSNVKSNAYSGLYYITGIDNETEMKIPYTVNRQHRTVPVIKLLSIDFCSYILFVFMQIKKKQPNE